MRTITAPRVASLLVLASLACSLVACDGNGDGGGSQAPAVLSFPPANAVTDQGMVTVRGRTVNPSILAAVRINGVLATTTDAFATFSGNVATPVGTTEIEIELENLSGATFSFVASRVVNGGPLLEEPSDVRFQTAANRLLVADRGLGIVSISLTTGVRSILSSDTVGNGPVIPTPVGLVLDPAAGEAIVLDVDGALFAVDQGSGNRTQLSSGAALGSPGGGIDLGLLGTTALAPTTDDDGLYEVDLMSPPNGAETLISGGNPITAGAGPALSTPLDVALDDSVVLPRALIVDSGTSSVVAVDLQVGPTFGDRTVVSSNSLGGGPTYGLLASIAFDAPNQRAFVADAGPTLVYDVELAGPTAGDRTVLSGVDLVAPLQVGTGTPFGSPAGMDLDLANDRLFVADSARRAVFAVALATGNRTELGTPGIGTGARFTDLRDLAFAPAAEQIFALHGTPLVLVRVDPATGNRTIVSGNGVGSGPDFIDGADLALDEAGGRAFVMGAMSVFAVSLASGERTSLAAPADGGGAIVTVVAFAFDAPGNRLLLVDTAIDSVIALDLATLARTILAGPGIGTSDEIDDPVAIVVDSASRALVLDRQGSGRVIAIDLAPGAMLGQQTVISDGNLGGQGPSFPSAVSLALDPAGQRAFVLSDDGRDVLEMDLSVANLGMRTLVADEVTGAGPLVGANDLAFDAGSERLLFSDDFLRGIGALDPVNGDRALLSK